MFNQSFNFYDISNYTTEQPMINESVEKVEKVEKVLDVEPENRLEKDQEQVEEVEEVESETNIGQDFENLKNKLLTVKNKTLFIKKNKDKIKALEPEYQREFLSIAKGIFDKL